MYENKSVRSQFMQIFLPAVNCTTRTLVNFKDATGMKEIANAQKQDTCEKSGSSVDEIY